MGEFGSIFCVAALNSFTKSIMFKPCGPNAWPMAGPGLATPAGQRNRITALTPAMALRAVRLRSARVQAARLRSEVLRQVAAGTGKSVLTAAHACKTVQQEINTSHSDHKKISNRAVMPSRVYIAMRSEPVFAGLAGQIDGLTPRKVAEASSEI